MFCAFMIALAHFWWFCTKINTWQKWCLQIKDNVLRLTFKTASCNSWQHLFDSVCITAGFFFLVLSLANKSGIWRGLTVDFLEVTFFAFVLDVSSLIVLIFLIMIEGVLTTHAVGVTTLKLLRGRIPALKKGIIVSVMKKIWKNVISIPDGTIFWARSHFLESEHQTTRDTARVYRGSYSLFL